MKLTDEQKLIVASDSEALRVIAFAGTGKTFTLRAYAQARPEMSFIYLAFNRAIKEEAEKKFPLNVQCVTTHALAFRKEGYRFRHKLAASVRANQVAKALGTSASQNGLIGANRAFHALNHFLSSPYYGFEEFCNMEGNGHYSPDNLRDAERLWEAMIDPKNIHMPMLHDGYLKLYQLSCPKLDFDCILFDEAQDANPVTLEIIRMQSCRKVFVGDPHQQIYQFRRATNAMSDPLLTDTLYLTESFRFNKSIAAKANLILAMKREQKHVKGKRTVSSSKSKAYISRGNAAIFTKAASMALYGKGVHFVGGIDGYGFDLLMDIWHLSRGNKVSIKDQFIRTFQKYADFVEYVESQNERDLLAWVNVIKKHENPDAIPFEISEIRKYSIEEASRAELCVTTTHKSKGLEFGTVEIANDFPKPKLIEMPNVKHFNCENWQYGRRRCPSIWDGEAFRGAIVFPIEEINLRYVAATRAESFLIDYAWKDPDYIEILKYINKYPSFVLVEDEHDLYEVNASARERLRPGTQLESIQQMPIDGYGWSVLTPDRKSIKKTVDNYRLAMPQWSWEWLLKESISAASRGEKPATFLSTMAKAAEIENFNQEIENFLSACGILKKEGIQNALPINGAKAFSSSDKKTTLPDLIYAEYGVKVSSYVSRFYTEGWFSVGATKALCPRCTRNQLDGFRKPYKNAKGDLYHYWGLYCPICNYLYEPKDLGSESKKELKADAIPVNSYMERSILPDLISSKYGVKVSSYVSVFYTVGWFSVGITKAICPRCTDAQLDGFRKPHENSKGDKYQLWGLYCQKCNFLFELSDLSDESKDALNLT